MEWLDKVIELEGGYVDDPTDRGGETKYGISKKAYPNEDIKNLTIERAKQLYIQDYVKPCKADLLNKDIQYAHFDAAVNHGVKGAAKILQRASGVKDDGIIGKITLKACENLSLERYLLFRAFYYMEIVGNNPSQYKYIKGWANRLKHIL
jgi:lysozyme family protein